MKKKILFSFAHPDDETFIVGGLLATLATKDNVETIVYSATLGDAGKCGNPAICEKHELATTRKEELTQACSFLGVDSVLTGTYLDGTLLNHLDKLTVSITEILKDVQPDMVVTFPAHGISGHNDHKAMHVATLQALATSEHPYVKKVYYATFPAFLRNNRSFLEQLDEIDLIVPFEKEASEKVRQALLSHKTQHLSVERVFPDITESTFLKHENKEYFLLAVNNDDSISLEQFITTP